MPYNFTLIDMIFSFFVTMFSYLFIPAFFCLFFHKKLGKKTIVAITILNYILIFCLWSLYQYSHGSKPNSYIALVWSGIAYLLMRKYSLINIDNPSEQTHVTSNSAPSINVPQSSNKKIAKDKPCQKPIIIMLSLLSSFLLCLTIILCVKIQHYNQKVCELELNVSELKEQNSTLNSASSKYDELNNKYNSLSENYEDLHSKYNTLEKEYLYSNNYILNYDFTSEDLQNLYEITKSYR